MLTKTLSLDLGPSGVLVACFCPGWVQTDMGGGNAKLTPEQVGYKIVHPIWMDDSFTILKSKKFMKDKCM